MRKAEPKTYFGSGNEACVEAAIVAGCRFFAGYPIPPSNQISEDLSECLPLVGSILVQMEDEIASIGRLWVRVGLDGRLLLLLVGLVSA